MSETFLVDIDPSNVASGQLDGLSLETIRCLERVFITATPESLQSAIRFIRQEFRFLTISVDASRLDDPQAIIELLNAGAVRVIVAEKVLISIVQYQAVQDVSRLGVSLPIQDIAAVRDAFSIRPADFGFLTAFARSSEHDVPTLTTLERAIGAKPSTVLVKLDKWDPRVYSDLVKSGTIPVVRSSDFTSDSQQSGGKAPVATLFTSILTSDRPDKLWTTVVVDERDRCLGLVYSNGESITEALKSRRGVYKSRKRNELWIKGEISGDIQELIKVGLDCDKDALLFKVHQKGDGFCHLKTETCFGSYSGLSKLEKTIKARHNTAPAESYTRRMFDDPKLLEAKLLEEASELGQAKTADEVAFEAADLIYFAVTKCVAAGVDLRAVERNLDLKSLKVSRRKGDAKPEWASKVGIATNGAAPTEKDKEDIKEAAAVPKDPEDEAGTVDGKIRMKSYVAAETDEQVLQQALQRPSQRSSEKIMQIVREIIDDVQSGGDEAVLKYTKRFEKADSLKSPILRAPYPAHLMKLDEKTKAAMDTSFENIRKFHAAQEVKPLEVETMSGVVCSRFSRAIERVGLYVPGGTAVLPSTALMLGVPAMVAGCRNILLASPPRADGTITPELVYAAHKVNAEGIVLAGGAQAIAAMAYGTENITKVDKILGPGNQFVTAAKMLVSNDTNARVAIDMPAGPSEVLVIADKSANPAFVAADLLSQAEHGPDSQVVLIAIDLSSEQLQAIETELHNQANALPRVDIVRGAIDHSVTVVVRDLQEALRLSNDYAPEHLILQIENAADAVKLVENAGSVFIGMWTPESVGDYSAGVNHSLPTYGYAKQYSGVNLGSFTKQITSSQLTQQGLRNIGPAVTQLAGVEGLDAHARAVSIRLSAMDSDHSS